MWQTILDNPTEALIVGIIAFAIVMEALVCATTAILRRLFRGKSRMTCLPFNLDTRMVTLPNGRHVNIADIECLPWEPKVERIEPPTDEEIEVGRCKVEVSVPYYRPPSQVLYEDSAKNMATYDSSGPFHPNAGAWSPERGNVVLADGESVDVKYETLRGVQAERDAWLKALTGLAAELRVLMTGDEPGDFVAAIRQHHEDVLRSRDSWRRTSDRWQDEGNQWKSALMGVAAELDREVVSADDPEPYARAITSHVHELRCDVTDSASAWRQVWNELTHGDPDLPKSPFMERAIGRIPGIRDSLIPGTYEWAKREALCSGMAIRPTKNSFWGTFHTANEMEACYSRLDKSLTTWESK